MFEDIHIFSADFKTVIGDIKGRLYTDCYDNLNVDIGGFTSLKVCDTEVADQFVFLGAKESVTDLQKGDAIAIDNNVIIITDIEIETKREFNEFCDRYDYYG